MSVRKLIVVLSFVLAPAAMAKPPVFNQPVSKPIAARPKTAPVSQPQPQQVQPVDEFAYASHPSNVPMAGSALSLRTGSIRTERKTGWYLGMGEPLGLMGINLAHNTTDFMRLVGGVALTPLSGGMLTFGGGVKFMIPNAAFTPVLGINAAYLTARGAGALVQYESVGIEYTAESGFHIGAGVNLGFIALGASSGSSSNSSSVNAAYSYNSNDDDDTMSGSMSRAKVSLTPYLNIGYFF